MGRRVFQFLCGLVGHPHGHRATEHWAVQAKEWWPNDPSYGVYVCDRCSALMPGQSPRTMEFR